MLNPENPLPLPSFLRYSHPLSLSTARVFFSPPFFFFFSRDFFSIQL